MRIERDETRAQSYRAHGLLTVKDVTRPIVLDATYTFDTAPHRDIV